MEVLGPDPLDLVAMGHRRVEFQLVIRGIEEIRDIVDPVAGGDAGLGGGIIQFLLVDHHGPAFSFHHSRGRDHLGLDPAGRQ